jgi:hypothetical protein
VRSIKAALVEVMLRSINDIVHRDWLALDCRAAAMSKCGRCIHLVVVGEKWNNFAPRASA